MAAWACGACTYINDNALFVACEACGTARAEDSDASGGASASAASGGASAAPASPGQAIDLSGVSEGALRAGASAADDATLAQALQSSFDAEEAKARTAAEQAAAAKEEAAGLAADLCWKLRRDVGSFVARAARQLEVEEVEHNPASRPGEPLYEKFRRAVDQAEDKTIRLVFHGSPEANMDAIAKDGLDPKRRGSAVGQAYGAGEYFGTDVSTSLGYCRGGKKMLVFAVLCDSSGVTREVDLGGGGGHLYGAPAIRAQPAKKTAAARAVPKAVANQFFSASHQQRLAAGIASSSPATAAAAAAEPEEAAAPVKAGILVIHKVEYQLPLCIIHLQLGAWSDTEMERRKAAVRETILRKRQLAKKSQQQASAAKPKRAKVTASSEVILLSSDDE